ncbi:MAG TPA: class I SAM-dependent methyltransferase, partial [Pseudomonadales bacterium]|nr:class I SAM-dependent methyltransferase [Pseudomonadales bacterium]
VDDETPFIVIQEYEAPKTIDPDKVKRRTSELVSVIKAAYSSPDDHLFYKTRARQRGDAQYERLSKTAGFHLTMEGAARLRVNFEDFIDTGLFLDHRPLRLRLYEEAKHKDFLNLFCYTAAATVHAALGGASSTTSVDMSKTFLDWAERNFDANAITGKAHRLVRADCLAWIESAPAESWDLIFLDPPTFSNSKRMKETFDVQADHVHLIDKAMRLLREDGTLYFSTNLRNFHLDPSLGERFTLEAFATIPFDFRRRQNIHHCWKLTRLPK